MIINRYSVLVKSSRYHFQRKIHLDTLNNSACMCEGMLEVTKVHSLQQQMFGPCMEIATTPPPK